MPNWRKISLFSWKSSHKALSVASISLVIGMSFLLGIINEVKDTVYGINDL